VAHNYDLMNDAMSLGVHRCWKDQFVGMLGPLKGSKVRDEKTGEVTGYEPMKVLDVAAGSGDISFRMLKKAAEDSKGQAKLGVEITMTDINADMLEVGKRRAVEQNLFHDLKFQVLNAQDLSSFQDEYFDIYTIAFGIRNVTDRPKALQQAFQKLKKGGRFMCLEFSEVQVPIFKEFYDFWSFNVIPQLGQVLANDAASY